MSQMIGKPKQKHHEDGDILDFITLEQIFEFDEYDLRANRQGVISDQQKALLFRRQRVRSNDWLILAGTLLVFPLIVVMTYSGRFTIWFQLAIVAIVAGAVLWVTWNRRKSAREIFDDTVEAAEGILHRSTSQDFPPDFDEKAKRGDRIFYPQPRPHPDMQRMHGETIEYYVYIDRTRLSISASQYWNLEPWDDEPTIIYYTPKSRQILSVELLNP